MDWYDYFKALSKSLAKQVNDILDEDARQASIEASLKEVENKLKNNTY